MISCLCPTYKRPALLANAVACFLRQDYAESELIVLDDAGQFNNQCIGNVRIISTAERLPSLPAKFNRLASGVVGDVLVPWEDDDVFLPWHLSTIAESVNRGGEFVCYREVYSTYGLSGGRIRTEPAAGRFHSSWAFTREVFDRIGGYPDTNRLDFDQQMGGRLRKSGRVEFNQCERPGYVYRWGNGVYHGSQSGEHGYRALWHSLVGRPRQFIGELVPELDGETLAMFALLGIEP